MSGSWRRTALVILSEAKNLDPSLALRVTLRSAWAPFVATRLK
jgi:hypothetical protein